MYFERVGINHVRNLSNVIIEPDPRVNYFYGVNAAGKTAILEAIYLLAHAKSFRSPRINDVIQHYKKSLSVTAKIVDDNRSITTALEKDKQETQVRFDDEKITRLSEQTRNIPLFVITPESHRILTGTPKERRHWLDWAMFHVEPGYIDLWRDYHHALRHRNTLLRERASNSQLVVWEEIMAEKAAGLFGFRGKYLEDLANEINSMNETKFNRVKISQKPGRNEDFLEYLIQQRPGDIQAGHTRAGPHREDVLFLAEGKETGRTLSRGETKLFVVLLIVAQAIVFIKRTDKRPVLLVDDITAELDENGRKRALDCLLALGSQLFINATLAEVANAINSPHSRFHVEHGRVVKMVE